MHNYIVATECAIEHDGKFLIIKRPATGHAGGLLSFPGGKFEASEPNKAHVAGFLLGVVE